MISFKRTNAVRYNPSMIGTVSMCLVAAAMVVAVGAPALANVQTVRGRLVDQECYLQDKKANIGDSHPGMATDCATTCAQKGSPVALLAADGKLYEVTGGLAANNNAKLVPHIAHVVEITGNVTKSGGTMTIAANDLKMLRK